jgi:hypothetical protein
MTKKPVELDRSRTPVVLIVLVVLGALLTTGAVMWGRSDTGMIDVSATIANSQYVAEHSNGEEGTNPTGYATQAHTDLPNGGLVPAGSSGDVPPPAPAPESVVEENASTTMTESEEESGAPVTSDEASSGTQTDEDATAPGDENSSGAI